MRRVPGSTAALVGAAVAGLVGLGTALLLLLAGSAVGVGVALAVSVVAWLSACVLALRERSRLLADVTRVRAVAGQSTERVTVLSHEIRTPLSLIKGASDLLLEQSPGPLNPQQLSFMTTISTNSENLVQLAEDLLTQARIDAGMFELHLTRTDLRLLARRTVDELRLLHTVTIGLDTPGAPPRLWVDANLVRQAIVNLVNNAVKASPEASRITVRVVDSGEGGASISVHDNGSGMNDMERRRLFERFASGHPLRDGTGMGLVITRQIAQLHGGALYVDTVAGRGTTIIMTLPALSEVDDDDEGAA